MDYIEIIPWGVGLLTTVGAFVGGRQRAKIESVSSQREIINQQTDDVKELYRQLSELMRQSAHLERKLLQLEHVNEAQQNQIVKLEQQLKLQQSYETID